MSHTQGDKADKARGKDRRAPRTARSVQSARSAHSVRSVRSVRESGVVGGDMASDASQPSQPSRVVRASTLVKQNEQHASSQDIAAQLREKVTVRPKTIDFDKRRKEQKSARRLYWAKRVSILVGVLGVLAFGVWALLFSSWLKVESDQIRISGAGTWARIEKIQALTNVQVGRSLLLVSDAQLATQLDAIPGVASVDITKDYPHGLIVRITEETPTAQLLAQDTKQYTAVDAQAQQITTYKDAAAGIPVITVPTTRSGLKNQAVLESIAVLSDMDAGMRGQVTQTTARTQDSITTALNSGYTVVWGNSSSMSTKRAIVAKVIQQLQAEGTNSGTIDVSAPSRPIIK